MATRFRLGTLERLRTTTLEERGRALHAAALALAAGRADHAALVEAMTATAVPSRAAADAARRAALYRERLRTEIVAAAGEVMRLEGELDRARQAWLEARAQLKAVTALHARHRAAVRAEAARREQRDLDDLAGTMTARSGAKPAGTAVAPSPEGGASRPVPQQWAGTR